MSDKGDSGAVEKVRMTVIGDLADRTQFARGQSSKIELRLCGHTVIKNPRGYKVRR